MKNPSKKPAKHLTNLDRKVSPEEEQFGFVLKYLDGTITPEEFAKFQKQLRENPKYLREFADTLLLDVQLSDLAREEKRKMRPINPGGKSTS